MYDSYNFENIKTCWFSSLLYNLVFLYKMRGRISAFYKYSDTGTIILKHCTKSCKSMFLIYRFHTCFVWKTPISIIQKKKIALYFKAERIHNVISAISIGHPFGFSSKMRIIKNIFLVKNITYLMVAWSVLYQRFFKLC